MSSIEIVIGNQKYVLRGDESEEHLREVAEMVRRKVEAVRKSSPALSFQKAAVIAAFDFAAEAIKGRRRASDYRSSLLERANCLLSKVEAEIATESHE